MIEAGVAANILGGSYAGTQSAVKNMSASQIDKVSKDFESLFIGMMLEHMFGDSVGTEAFGDKESSDIYKGLMTENYGKAIAQAGGIGVASYVKTELLKLQEQEN
jgi:Rod binding domain-containing protein